MNYSAAGEFKILYSLGKLERYNRVPVNKRAPVAHPLLEAVKVYHADNYSWALACCAWHRDIAEDVLQESYLRVLEGRAKFLGKSSDKTWFFSVIKRVSADLQRTQKRHSLLNMRMVVSDQAASGGSKEDHPASPDDTAQRSEASQQLQAALMQLSVRQREVLHLVFYTQLTLEEAAQTLGVSLGSTRTHYQRGKDRVAQLLELDDTYEH